MAAAARLAPHVHTRCAVCRAQAADRRAGLHLRSSGSGSQLQQLRSARAEIRTLNRTVKALRADGARSQDASTKLEQALNAQHEAAETLTSELEEARARATDKASALRALEAEHNRSMERVDELSNRTRVRPRLASAFVVRLGNARPHPLARTGARGLVA